MEPIASADMAREIMIHARRDVTETQQHAMAHDPTDAHVN